jgi:alkylation response protein AidB-like acyl-CoA dehydrogenase
VALDAFASQPLDPIPPPDSPLGYRRVTLHRGRQLEITRARWLAQGQSALHGHGRSAALYSVLSGRVEEERYLPDGGAFRCEIVELRAGDRSYLPPGCFHRVRALEEAMTLHSYSPPAEDATAAVPPAVLPLLQEARLRAAEERAAPSPGPVAARLADIVAEVRERLDGWAGAERQAQLDHLRRLPPRILEEIRTSGLLAAPIPVELGGWGASLEQTAAAVRLVAQRAPAAALALAMPLGNAATTRIPAACVPVALVPALRQGHRWIADRACGGQILAVANSEPGAGGDLANTQTRACLGEDGHYLLTGRKSFATFGRDADYFLCAARRTAADNGDARGVVDGFFVAREAPGLTVDDRWDPVGMGPTASVGLTLEAARAEALLGYPGCLEGVNARHWSTVLFAAVFLGVGEGALREAVQQAPAGGTWSRSALAECALTLDAAAGFVERVAADERWPFPAAAQDRARRAKTFVARAAVETAMRGAMVAGGRSYTPNHPVFRFLCDALAGPLLRPPLPQAMDAIVQQLFPVTPHLERVST